MSRDAAHNPATTPETTLSKAYDPHAIEQRIYESWEKAGDFAPTGKGDPYCIMIPPPNVTGSLHMGHAFQDTIMDALIRYHRMKGQNTLWQAGTDHAGIATQMVVERQLEAEGKKRHDLGRERFIERVWQWKGQSGGTITKQLRRMGAALDWSRERFTMDEGLSHTVTEVFVRLYEEGLIYRGQRLVNWDPVLHTAVSDLEVISEEENGFLWHIRYPIAKSTEYLVVATTRPETMLGDTAVAVHPDDERYKHLIGRCVELPLAGRKIPIIADTYVDPAFGSGCVKITPAHDFNDYQVWQRHKDQVYFKSQPYGGLINIFSIDAKIKKHNFDEYAWGRIEHDRKSGQPCYEEGFIGLPTKDLIPPKYCELDRFEARQQIIADLEAAGLLEKVQDHKLMIPRGDRTNAVIEPYLTDQWYVKVAPLAEQAIKVVEDGRIKFVPENWTKTYYEWMNNIQDWCISSQIWWGHRVPAWYDADGNIYVARTEAEAKKKARAMNGVDTKLEQDKDVLDTWFSSALWPFSTLGWPEKTPELKAFYPTSVLVTGFDIIFFWVARMIMMGLKFTGEVPFKEVYIHGLVRDGHGQKMSKSKGNVLDPLDLIDGIDLESLVAKRTTGLMRPQDAPKIEQATRKEFANGIPAHGADALRYTFASLATQGRDIKFDLGRIDGYRNFCNKLWNAARYVLMNTEGHDCGTAGLSRTEAGEGPRERGKLELTAADHWIRSRLTQTTIDVETGFREYRFDIAAQAIYSFVWHEYCDWYLELSKVALNDPNSTPEQLRGTRHTLVSVLEALLRLAHPLMPFITEEIWQRVAPLAGKHGNTIMRQPYPDARPQTINPAAAEEMQWVMAVISAVRTIRSERDISPAKALPVLLADGSDREHTWMRNSTHYLKLLGRMETLTWLNKDEPAPESIMELVGDMKVLVPLGSLIDKKAELERLQREIEKNEKELDKAKTKLANQEFVARAPTVVVEEVRARVQQFEQDVAKFKAQYAQVAALPG
ncbi:MAG: valine--tRNA ligase [Gammaproteobacteria bacterium]|nr:valine--tRNA ligase [Gammaproteobacteria bacterium]